MNERKEQMPVKFTVSGAPRDIILTERVTEIMDAKANRRADGKTEKRSIFSITHLAQQASIIDVVSGQGGHRVGSKISVDYRLQSMDEAYKFCRDHDLPSSKIYDMHKDRDILLEADIKGEGWFSVYHTFEVEENPVKRALELGAYLRHRKEFIRKNGFYILPVELAVNSENPTASIDRPTRVKYTWPEELE